jgi:hypothetical protein
MATMPPENMPSFYTKVPVSDKNGKIFFEGIGDKIVGSKAVRDTF